MEKTTIDTADTTTTTRNRPTSLIDDLHVLHDDYVDRINRAIGQQDLDRAQSLAVDFDHQMLRLVADRDDLLDDEAETSGPQRRRAGKDTPLRRWARNLRLVPAA